MNLLSLRDDWIRAGNWLDDLDIVMDENTRSGPEKQNIFGHGVWQTAGKAIIPAMRWRSLCMYPMLHLACRSRSLTLIRRAREKRRFDMNYDHENGSPPMRCQFLAISIRCKTRDEANATRWQNKVDETRNERIAADKFFRNLRIN